jgi:aurora kinase
MPQSQPLDALMSELSVGSHPSTKASTTNASSTGSTGGAAGQGRLKPMILNRYCSPAFQRPPNTGLAARSAEQDAQQAQGQHRTTHGVYNESARGPLLKLAGINVPVPGGTASPAKPKQYVAHGVHGPAHGTSSRLGAASSTADGLKVQGGHARLHTASSSQNVAAQNGSGSTSAPSGSGSSSKGGLGAYDGGFETDVKDREAPQGEAARMLEMESHKPG